jgi:hypothetical protein
MTNRREVILTFFILLGIATAIPSSILSQPKGHWEKHQIAGDRKPTGMSFSDSINGMIESSSTIYRTSNGGESWDSVGWIANSQNEYDCRNFHSTSPKDAYTLVYFGMVYSTHDSGRTWDTTYLPPGDMVHDYFGGISRAGYGIIIARYYRGFAQEDSVIILETRDLAKTFDTLSAIYAKTLTIHDGISTDSLHQKVLFEDHSNQPVLFQTSTGGKQWARRTATGSGGTRLNNPRNLVVTSDASRFYILLEAPPFGSSVLQDFIATTDGGDTWRVDTTFQGRIYLLSSSSVHNLWTFVGHTIWEVGPDLSDVYPKLTGYADSLMFSSDEGLSWHFDPSFIGDTVLMMTWPDSTHGYVVTRRDKKLYVYRWIEGSNGVAVNTTEQPLALREEPVRDWLVFDSPTSLNSSVEIIDVLGRTVMRFRQNLQTSQHRLDVRGLPSGEYSLKVSNGQKSWAARFVKVK